MLSYIAKLVNEGLFSDGGRIRGVPITTSGSSYIPPLPNATEVENKIKEIIEENVDTIDVAIKLYLYCMKMQIFLESNKRTAIIFANHYLISHGGGLLVIPERAFRNLRTYL